MQAGTLKEAAIMKTIEITFTVDVALITITTEDEITIRRVKQAAALVWMYKQGLKWNWGKTEDGLEQASWSRE